MLTAVKEGCLVDAESVMNEKSPRITKPLNNQQRKLKTNGTKPLTLKKVKDKWNKPLTLKKVKDKLPSIVALTSITSDERIETSPREHLLAINC